MPRRPMTSRQVREAKQARVDKYYNVGKVIGTAAGVVPFVAGKGSAGLDVSPLAIPAGYVGNRLGGEVGTDLANLVNRIQFGKHV
jgi:hypothetical protein